jgi:hypothetical protein
MANDKEVIKRLLKIAENQQKIITKLAQGLEAEPLAAGPSGGSGVEAGSLAGSIKAALKSIFPKMLVKSLEVSNAEGSRPSLTMTVDQVPSGLGPTLTEQFLLKGKIPTSLLVNGTELKK